MVLLRRVLSEALSVLFLMIAILLFLAFNLLIMNDAFFVSIVTLSVVIKVFILSLVFFRLFMSIFLSRLIR